LVLGVPFRVETSDHVYSKRDGLGLLLYLSLVSSSGV